MRTIGTLIGCSALLASAIAAEGQSTSGADPVGGWRYETIDLKLELEPDGRLLTVRGSATLRLVAGSSTGPTLLLRT